MTEPRSTLLLKSTFHGAAPVETWPIVVKEITVVGSRCGPFAKAIALLRSGKVDPTPLISRTYPLQDAPQAIAYAQRSGVLRFCSPPHHLFSRTCTGRMFQDSRIRLGERVYSRLMHDRDARRAKPLSMFTTVTLDAHEFSIPSSAATPPKLAP